MQLFAAIHLDDIAVIIHVDIRLSFDLRPLLAKNGHP